MRNKWASRKFWISVAAFLGSIGASIAGIATSEKWVTVTGIVCGMLSAAIYSAVEAYADGANGTQTIEHIVKKDTEEALEEEADTDIEEIVPPETEIIVEEDDDEREPA